MRHWLLSIACILVALSAWASDAGQVLGHWLTPEDNAVIAIYRDGERFSGRIVSLKEPNYPDGHSQAGQPKRDSNNPDESKQDRRIVGFNMIEGFEYIGDGRYEGGTIYDPRNGVTYQCEMSLQSDGTLEVRGYVGLSLFGKTQVWRPKP